jgi:hypothetical protein
MSRGINQGVREDGAYEYEQPTDYSQPDQEAEFSELAKTHPAYLKELLMESGYDAWVKLQATWAAEAEAEDDAAEAQWELDRYIPERDGR